jgi:hypothetical protein
MAALLSQERAAIGRHITAKTRELDWTLGQLSQAHQAAHEEITQATAVVNENIAVLVRNIDDRAERERRQEMHQRLLKSLKTETMNERRHQIKDPHSKTFHWIFENSAPAVDESIQAGSSNVASDTESEWGSDHATQGSASDDSDRLEKYGTGIISDTLRARQAAASTFIQWAKDPSSKIFWISGKPGSGKSTLMKFLADDPRTVELLDATFTESRAAVLAHFFWIAGCPMESSVKGLLCSLLYQLILEQLEGVSHVQVLLDKHPNIQKKDSVSDWSENELRLTLFSVLSNLDRRFCLFIDGLDEVGSSVEQLQLLDVVRALQQVPSVKLCLSSRPEPILERSLTQYPMFRIQDLTYHDIWSFATDALQNGFGDGHPDPHWSSIKYEQILIQICEMAEGVFLWVALCVRNLTAGMIKGDGPEEVLERLQALPRDLLTLYNGMWDRMGDDRKIYQAYAARCFNLLLVEHSLPHSNPLGLLTGGGRLIDILLAREHSLARDIIKDCSEGRPLISSDELTQRCRDLKTKIEARCAGLLEVHISGDEWLYGSVRFVHRSAVEFLRSQSGTNRLLDCDKSTPETLIYDTILAHLAATCLDKPRLNLPSFAPDALEFLTLADREVWQRCDLSQAARSRMITECANLVGRRSASLPVCCSHFDFTGILAFLLSVDFLDHAIQSLPSGTRLPDQYAAYLFVSGLKVLPDHYWWNENSESLTRPSVFRWLCRIAPRVDLSFRRLLCSGPGVCSDYLVPLGRRTARAPETPLTISINCLQQLDLWHMRDQSRSRYETGLINLFQSLLHGASSGVYLPCRVVIELEVKYTTLVDDGPQVVWSLFKEFGTIAKGRISNGEQTLLVKTNMRLVVALLALSMHRLRQGDVCQLLLQQLSPDIPCPFKFEVTELLVDMVNPRAVKKGDFKSTTRAADLAKIESMFETHLESELQSNLPPASKINGSQKGLGKSLLILFQQIWNDHEVKGKPYTQVESQFIEEDIFWRWDDPRARPPEGDLIGKMYGWAEENES